VVSTFDELPFLNRRNKNTINEAKSKSISPVIDVSGIEMSAKIRFLRFIAVLRKKIMDNQMGHSISLSLLTITGVMIKTSPTAIIDLVIKKVLISK